MARQFIGRIGRPRRLAALGVVVAAVIVACVWVLASRGADQAPRATAATSATSPAPGPGASPNCDGIGGEELARTDRWRIVHTGDGGPYGADDSPTPVIACDRTAAGSAKVRLLGMAKVEIGPDSGPEGGPYMTSGGIGGDVVLLTSTTYDQLGNTGGFRETSHTTLFDLARGASVRLPGDGLQRYSYFHDSVIDHELRTFVTPAGGVTTVYAQRDGRHARTRIGPATVWDARGRRSVRGELAATATFGGAGGKSAGSGPGDRAASGALYYRTARGTNRRTEVRGAADLSTLRPDPHLGWRWMALDSQNGDEAQLAGELARPVRRGVTVLDGDGVGAIEVVRFADPARGFRVRLRGYATTERRRAFFDLPATSATRRQASAAVGNGTYAYADGASVRLWNRTGGHVYPATGLHDLALSGSAVFGTDASGQVQLFGPYAVKPPPANDRPNPPENADGAPPPNG